MPKAFSDYRVIDFSTTIAGPYCSRLLSDLGAEVIKIETSAGDMMRSRPPLRDGASSHYGQLNAGKKSIVLDLKSPDAVAAVKRLIANADVVVENFRPGVMQRFGLDYPSIADLNERLIFCSISGFGQDGPRSGEAAYAPVIHATSGFDLAHLVHQRGRERPDNCGIFIADVLAGTYAFGAIAAALDQRHSTGKGQYLDVSMMESMLSLTLTEMQAAQFDVPPPPKRPLFGPIETADGYINLAVASERTFYAMAAAAGREDWLTDPRFEVYIDRRRNWGELMDEFEAWSATLPSAQCLKVLAENNVPAAAYRTVREAMGDPQIAHRKAFAEVHDAGGSMKVLGPPFKMSASDTTPGPRVAALGEHTREVLEDAGLNSDEIAELMG